MSECLFCRIAAKEIPSDRVDEGEEWFAFRDINPTAPTHILIIPRKHFSTVNELGRCLMTNLSRGGLFVATATPCEIGTRIQLRIEIAEIGETVEVLGEVISVGGGASLRDEEPGIGVLFRDLDDVQRKAIDDLYEDMMQRAVE